MGIWRHAKAIERLEDRLRSLEIKCDELERARRSTELEFEELFDKVKRMMSRVSKRVAVDAKDASDAILVDSENSPSDMLDPISRGILARRGSRMAK